MALAAETVVRPQIEFTPTLFPSNSPIPNEGWLPPSVTSGSDGQVRSSDGTFIGNVVKTIFMIPSTLHVCRGADSVCFHTKVDCRGLSHASDLYISPKRPCGLCCTSDNIKQGEIYGWCRSHKKAQFYTIDAPEPTVSVRAQSVGETRDPHAAPSHYIRYRRAGAAETIPSID